MAKLILEIDDANPTIVAMVGEGSLVNISGQEGYMEMVENPDYIPGENDEFIPNPEGRGEWLGRKYVREMIAPRLVAFARARARAEAARQADAQVDALQAAIVAAAQITIQ